MVKCGAVIPEKEYSLRRTLLYFRVWARYTTVDNNEKAVGSVVIVMNEAPTGGALTVIPTTGTALNTTFSFQTSG